MTLSVAAAERDCPLCRARDFEVVGLRDRDGSALRTVMCRTCGHVFTNPAPGADDLAAYYALRYRAAYKGVTTPKPKHVLRAGLRALERLARLRPFCPPPARALDVGAGGGEFAYLLHKAGYNVTGIEPNAGYGTYAGSTYAIDIRRATLQDVTFAPATFDLITLHHVLEHLPEPATALAVLHEWLKPGGLLIVEVPSALSWFHAPRRRFHAAHVHTFNPWGMEDLARAAGYTVESSLLTPGPSHINVVLRRAEAPEGSAGYRDASGLVRNHYRRHTAWSHIVSGWAVRRLWGNAWRPWRERRHLKSLGDPRGRDILDRLYLEALP